MVEPPASAVAELSVLAIVRSAVGTSVSVSVAEVSPVLVVPPGMPTSTVLTSVPAAPGSTVAVTV